MNFLLHPKRESMRANSIANAIASQSKAELAIKAIQLAKNARDRQQTLVEPVTSEHKKTPPSDRSMMDFSSRKYDDIHLKRDFTKTQL
jgi:hypothetical protein